MKNVVNFVLFYLNWTKRKKNCQSQCFYEIWYTKYVFEIIKIGESLAFLHSSSLSHLYFHTSHLIESVRSLNRCVESSLLLSANFSMKMGIVVYFVRVCYWCYMELFNLFSWGRSSLFLLFVTHIKFDACSIHTSLITFYRWCAWCWQTWKQISQV